MIQCIYSDRDIFVGVKPAGIISTDEPGGFPDLVREYIGNPDTVVKTVHRLDQTVSGLMVVALRKKAAVSLSKQIADGIFQKEYFAATSVPLPSDNGNMHDYLLRDPTSRISHVSNDPLAKEAVLHYMLWHKGIDCTVYKVRLKTGRTHQIRVQFSSRGSALIGDRKYGDPNDMRGIALWSGYLGFKHPYSGVWTEFKMKPQGKPWDDIM